MYFCKGDASLRNEVLIKFTTMTVVEGNWHGEGSCSVSYMRYDGSLALLSTGADGKIVLRSTNDTSKIIRSFSNPKEGALFCLAVSPKFGKSRFLTGASGEVRVSSCCSRFVRSVLHL